MKHPKKHFIQVNKSTLFFIKVMCMELTRFNQFILNIKFINI